MTNARISIIIVHHNTPEQLSNLLENIHKEQKFQIIVVDNASKEFSESYQKKYPLVTFIKNNVNRGYAFACNQGVTIAKGDWLLFLNPDIEISPESIHEWLLKTKEQKFQASSPKPLSENYIKPVPSVLSLLAEFTPLKWIVPLSLFTHKTLTGGALLIDKNLLINMGGWDERFFIWFEDSDVTKRLLDKHVPFGFISINYKHSGGESFKKWNNTLKKNIFFHSMEIYARKHFSLLGRVLISLVKKKYSDTKILPILQDGVSITVANMKLEMLYEFLEVNNKSYSQFDEIVIVSSALHEKDLWTLRRKYNSIRFIQIDNNSGFASTANIGLNTSTFRWTGTINDDVTMPADFLQHLMKYASKKTGSINPIIYSLGNEIESVGLQILPKGKALGIKTIPDSEYTKVMATNGAAIIYAHEALEKAGTFDEKFGSYLEDIDLSLRIARNGYDNIVVPSTYAVHKKHATSSTVLQGKKAWLDFKNWILVILKNWGIKKIILNSPQILIERLRNIAGIIKTINN